MNDGVQRVRPDLLTGYSSASDVPSSTEFGSGTINDSKDSGVAIASVSGLGQCGDIAGIQYDVAGSTDAGTPQDYMMGLNKNYLVVIRVDECNSNCNDATRQCTTGTCHFQTWQIPVSSSGCEQCAGAFGAAVTYRGSDSKQHIYFLSNQGSTGVVEVIMSELNLSPGSESARVQRLGVATEDSGQNDGMTCRLAGGVLPDIVFPTCGDKNGENNSPNPNPVTNADCNQGTATGYLYNPAAADRYGLVLPPRIKASPID